MKNVIAISGPTGSGESTITHKLIERFPGRMVRLVTATTRPPRDGEKDTVDYYFFSKEKFLALEQQGEILEKGYIPNRDVYYGTYRTDLENKLAAGFIVITNQQIVGTRYMRDHYDALTIFIEPGSLAELEGRIRSRSPELSDDEIHNRLKNAEDEIMTEGPEYQYHVINADGHLEEALDQIVEILKKEGYVLG